MTIYKLAVTRFDNKTYMENKEWRRLNDFTGTIYGSPIRISESILPETVLFVLEMNNSINQIMIWIELIWSIATLWVAWLDLIWSEVFSSVIGFGLKL